MKTDLLELFACPDCKCELDLRISEQENGEITSGELECTNCHNVFPIADGVPDLRFPSVETDA